jgi:hypothetical protein
MEKKYLQKIHVEDQSFEDLDFRLQEEIGIDYDNNEEYQIIEVGQGRAYGYVVRIDQMIEKLVYLNSLGATHIELNHDEDHIGYDISGFTLRPSTESEIEEYEEVQRIRKEKEEKRADLQRQLQELDDIKGENEFDDDLPF